MGRPVGLDGQFPITIYERTTALNHNETDTGDPVLVHGQSIITGLYVCNGNINLNVQQSIDGTNWDYTSTVEVRYSYSQKGSFNIGVVARYARVSVSISGSSTYFRCLVYARSVK